MSPSGPANSLQTDLCSPFARQARRLSGHVPKPPRLAGLETYLSGHHSRQQGGLAASHAAQSLSLLPKCMLVGRECSTSKTNCQSHVFGASGEWGNYWTLQYDTRADDRKNTFTMKVFCPRGSVMCSLTVGRSWRKGPTTSSVLSSPAPNAEPRRCRRAGHPSAVGD